MSLVWLALALGSKEVAVVFPLVLLAYDRLFLGGPGKARRERLWHLHLPLLAVLILTAAARAVSFFWVEVQSPPVATWQYMLMEFGVVWRYLLLLLAPLSQSIVHSVREVTTLLDAPAWRAGAGLIALCVVACRLRRRAPLAAFGVAWLLLPLPPASSLIPLNEAMAEHRVYLASCGFFMAVGCGLGHLSAWLTRSGVLPSPFVPRAALALVLGTLALLTVARNLVWADPVILWRDAARKAPETWLPHYALGDALRVQGSCPEAIPPYREALRLRPREPLVYTNLGVCLIAVGQLDEAERVFTSALRVDPRSVRARNNLGTLAMFRGNPDQARRHFLDVLGHDPGNILARRNLATLYETFYADPEEALRLCREIQRIAPQTAGVEECTRSNRDRIPAASSTD